MIAAPPAISLAASPARVALVGSAQQPIELRNASSRPIVVDAGLAGFALDARGRPRVAPAGTNAWLAVAPKRIAVPAHGRVTLAVRSTVGHRTSPGDHAGLVLLTSRPGPPGRPGLAVRMRIGVVVMLRVPGAIVHRLELRALRVRNAGRNRLLDLFLANRGNVLEALRARRLSVTLERGGKVLARLRPAARDLLPRSAGVSRVTYAGRVRGRLTALVEIKGGRPARREFRIRL